MKRHTSNTAGDIPCRREQLTPLDKILKRSLSIKGIDYVITLSPESIKLTRKGRRLGMELKSTDITSGESVPHGDTMAMMGHRSIQPVMRYFQTGAIGQSRAAWLLGNDPSGGGTPDSVGLSWRLFKLTPNPTGTFGSKNEGVPISGDAALLANSVEEALRRQQSPDRKYRVEVGGR
ncbi:MAG: hypothetical protein M3N50_11375 [Pseudomonadota bacterium]|nr:hypothetical protein [Pseudomonadota bacterium]